MASHAAQPPVPVSDRVLPLTRVLAAIIVPILLAAFLILYLFPNDTGRLFAWPIQPPMSAMMLGATYLGGAYFFSRVFFNRGWVSVKLGLLPVSTFAAILGVSTLLHWDKFTHGLFAFQLWAFLYFSLPFVIPVVWWLNRSQDAGSGGAIRFPQALRWGFGLLGTVLGLAGLILLVMPSVMIPVWPWSLTLLTARVMSAMFALSSFVGLGLAIDGRVSAGGAVLASQAVAIVFILLALILARNDVQWSSAGAWGLTAGLLIELGLAGWGLSVAARPSASPSPAM
jgi:hypothetical protein